MRGAAVAEWQNFLGISADGIFGPETTRVTKLFQGDHGLEPDGIVGPKTRAAAHLATTGAPPPGPVPVVAPVLTGPPSGYVASRPTDELRQIAKETLALGDPVGTSYPFEMDGKKYLAVVVPETTPGTVLAMDHGGARALVIYQPENQA